MGAKTLRIVGFKLKGVAVAIKVGGAIALRFWALTLRFVGLTIKV
jgi:Na+/alanine symporter